MRDAFIQTLLKEAKKDRSIMLLTGDLGFRVFEEFRNTLPHQFLNVGVAEQNMMGVACGLALSGQKVFAYTIATFATMRPFEQIRTDIASHNVKVVIVGTGAGLSYGHDSITHHSVEDIALMRGIPNMIVLCPADPIETQWATIEALRIPQPVYLRLGKRGEPILYSKDPVLKVGKASILKNGRGVAILATGNIVANAIASAKLLQESGINPLVASIHTIKPMDRKFIGFVMQKFPLIVAIEEHNTTGGLGSVIAEIISEQGKNGRLIRLGVPDRFLFEIGSQTYLRNIVGISPEKIAKRIEKELRKTV